jgi:glycosyltransferase involved in cell wall biosynthesis
MEESNFPLSPIKQRYLLVSGIVCCCDDKGNRYFDVLWHKDLIEHFKYLKDFTLISPCSTKNPSDDWIKIDAIESEFSKIKFIDLPIASNWLEAIIQLPLTTSVLWRAVQQADIVHAGIVGFPFPLGWLVTPAVYYWKKFYIIVVESAPWRLYSGRSASLKNRLRAVVFEFMGRWCLKQASLSIFTQEEYCNSFLDRNPRKGYVIPASWIDDDSIISNKMACQLWKNKTESRVMKIIFVGKLTVSKGILILLEALKLLDQKNISIKVDILGQGELLNECQNLENVLHNSVEIDILGTVSYGSPFFERLQQYHVVVVPSLSDEQPRIVFDAYSQAMPVVASDTPGLRSCIYPQRTGILVKPNDAIALSETLHDLLQNRDQLREMGLEALKVARQMSHRTMHQKRWQILAESLRQATGLPLE